MHKGTHGDCGPFIPGRPSLSAPLRLPGPYGPDGRKRPGVCIFQLRKLPSGAGVTRRTARLPGKPPSRAAFAGYSQKDRTARRGISPASGRPAFFCLFIFLFRSGVDIIHKASGGNDLLHERRERLPLIGLVLRPVVDDPAVKIHLHLVAVPDGRSGFRTLNDGKADIDGIAVKDPGEGLGNDTADAGALDG